MICYHKYGIANESNPAECEALARDLGDKWLMIMHNHGLLSVGRSVPEAFYYLYTLENACKVQVDVMASRAEIIFPDKDIVADLSVKMGLTTEQPIDAVTRAWEALIRMLDKQEPDYKS